MKLPNMKYADGIGKRKQVKFAGLYASPAATDGQLLDMQNLTAQLHPLLATRPGRMCRTLDRQAGGVFAWEGLCRVEGTCFYYNDELKGFVTEGMKTFASLGPYIVILPDKCWYHVETGEFGSMEAIWEGEQLTFCDGEIYGEPAAANCIEAADTDFAELFRPGDAVTISGCTRHSANNLTLVIREIREGKLLFYDNSFVLDEDGAAYAEEGALRIARTVPDLKGVFQCENRLWGYTDTEIRASKPGDIFNWNVLDGLESDCWAWEPGSAGVFTGGILYGGYPTFFKEDGLYKIYGSVPSDFQAMESSTMGVRGGCSASLAIAGEILFYLSGSGVVAYTGGIPQNIHEPFGTIKLRNGVGGSDGLRYYLSAQNESGRWRLYVYDTRRGMWHIEDNIRITHFTKHDGWLYMLQDNGDLWLTGGDTEPPEGFREEGPVEWFAEFADFTFQDPNYKGISKLQLRLELEEGAQVQVCIQYDSDGVWQPVGLAVAERGKRSVYLPVVPRRADHYRLKLTGIGGCRVHSLVCETYSGSEIR